MGEREAALASADKCRTNLGQDGLVVSHGDVGAVDECIPLDFERIAGGVEHGPLLYRQVVVAQPEVVAQCEQVIRLHLLFDETDRSINCTA